MKIKALGLFAASALALGSAMAQSTPTSPFTIRAGVLFPVSGSVRNAFSNTGFAFNASYDLPHFGMGGMNTGTVSIDGDYTMVSGHGNTFSSWGLLLADRFALSQGGTTTMGGMSPYFGLALGFYQHHASGGGVGNNTTKLGGKVMLGANFSERFNLEAFYRFSGSWNGTSTDVWGIMAGIRF